MKKYDAFLPGELIDLSAEIALATPVDTPLYTMVASRGQVGGAKDITVSWREKELNNTRAVPAKEGAEASAPIKSVRVMKSNICQILEKATSVSGTVRALAAQGVGDEFLREVEDRMVEMKRDAEYYFLNGTYSIEDETHARQMNGLLNLVANTVDTAAVGAADPGKLTEDALLDALQAMWASGASGDYFAFLNASEKRILNNLLKTATNARLIVDQGVNSLGIRVEKFESDFGVVNFVLDRHMPAGQILGVDLSLVEIAQLRAPFYEDLAKTGDYSSGHVIAEQSIKLLNTHGGFKIVGITK